MRLFFMRHLAEQVVALPLELVKGLLSTGQTLRCIPRMHPGVHVSLQASGWRGLGCVIRHLPCRKCNSGPAACQGWRERAKPAAPFSMPGQVLKVSGVKS